MRRDAHARPVAERSAVVAPVAPDLAALVAHYQRELRLLDWRLDVSYAPDLADVKGRQVWGLCYPVPDNKSARIVIRDPSTPPKGATPEQAAAQVVETVVHELTHLHFAPFGNITPAAIAAEEQAVWALAEALIRAKGTPDEAMYARAMLAQIDASKGRASVGPAQNDVTSALGAALRARFPSDGENCQGPWVQDTFASSVVYEVAGVLYELAFTFDGTTATLGAEPVRVIRSYSPAPASAPPVLAPAAPMSRAASAPAGDAPMSAPALSQKLIAMLIETAASGDKKAAPIAAAVLSELLGAAPAAEEPKPADPPADAPPPPAARVAPVTVTGSEPDALLAFGRVALAREPQVRAEGEPPLASLARLLAGPLRGLVSAVHILPFYPYTSDDGFSVIDYTAVDPLLGEWPTSSRCRNVSLPTTSRATVRTPRESSPLPTV